VDWPFRTLLLARIASTTRSTRCGLFVCTSWRHVVCMYTEAHGTAVQNGWTTDSDAVWRSDLCGHKKGCIK